MRISLDDNKMTGICDICINDSNFKILTCLWCRLEYRKTELAPGYELDQVKFEADLKSRMEKEFGK